MKLMSLELYLAFVAATAILILIPGPSVALIVANSVAHGAALWARHGRRHQPRRWCSSSC